MPEQNIGKVIQIIGPVLDIRFPADHLPNLLNAIHLQLDGRTIVAEVAQHIGSDTVRCIAMSSTDGLTRGMDAKDTGGPITVPLKTSSECRSTALLLPLKSRLLLMKCWRPALRSST